MCFLFPLIAEPNCKRSYWLWSSSSQRHEISCKQKVCPQRLGCKKLYVSIRISGPQSKLSDKEESVSHCGRLVRMFSVLMQKSFISVTVLNLICKHWGGRRGFQALSNGELKRSSPEGVLNSCSVLLLYFSLPTSSPQCCGFTLH